MIFHWLLLYPDLREDKGYLAHMGATVITSTQVSIVTLVFYTDTPCITLLSFMSFELNWLEFASSGRGAQKANWRCCLH